MALVVVTGEENADQEVSVPVPGRASPLRLRFALGSSFSGLPLSTVTFADDGTAVPLADQNGAIVTPFASGQDAIDASPSGGTIMLAPAVYNGLTADKPLQFVGMCERPSPNTVTLDIAVETNLTVCFGNCTVAFTAETDAILRAFNSQLSGAFDDTGVVDARESRIEDITGTPTITASVCQVANVAAIDATLEFCSFTGDVTCSGTLTIKGATSFGAVALNATNIVIDAESLRLAVFAGVVFNGVVSGFGGSTLTWGRNTGLVVGNFPNPGAALQNYTGSNIGNEAQNQVFAPRRGVLCFLIAKSTATFKFTVRVNGADTTLTVTVAASTVRDITHFVEVQASDLISVQAQNGGDPIASGSCLASCVFV